MLGDGKWLAPTALANNTPTTAVLALSQTSNYELIAFDAHQPPTGSTRTVRRHSSALLPEGEGPCDKALRWCWHQQCALASANSGNAMFCVAGSTQPSPNASPASCSCFLAWGYSFKAGCQKWEASFKS